MNWWNPETATVKPELHPVEIASIESLAERFPVDSELRRFWIENGYGFFIDGLNGEKLNDAASNRLMHPDEVLEILTEAADYERSALEAGLPFFERLDREFLMIDGVGRIVADGSKGIVVVADSLRDFLELLMKDPLFFEDLLS